MSIFDTVVFPKKKRNVFNLSHRFRGSAAFGNLYPIMCQEVLPGDSFQNQTSVFVRAMPMLAPLMHECNIYCHFFFVPNRLVWDNWKDFITGGEDGTADPVFPRMVLTGNDCQPGSLADYLGVGTNKDINQDTTDATHENFAVNALPFRAYSLIWNEFYRDQNLQEEVEIDTGDGIDTTTNRGILTRNWEKDYFTSALPWTQRGPQSVLPIGTEAPVVLDSDGIRTQRVVNRTQNSGENLPVDEGFLMADDGTLVNQDLSGSLNGDVLIDPNGTLIVDLRNAVAANVNQLRVSLALQSWLESNARGGARYIEQIFSHFGVTSSDARLQRPEFLGGSIQPLTISEVLQTSASTENSDLGDMAGHGISAGTSKQFRRFFEEHGFIIGILSIMPKTSYMNGTARVFRKFDKFDYAFPEFANLGEQAVYNSEIYQVSDNSGTADIMYNDRTFGYQSRYAEYKYVPNTVHGDLRTEAFSPWTLVRSFDHPPVLTGQFVSADSNNNDLGRIFPVTDSDTQFIFQCFHNLKAVRMLPKFAIPSI